MCERQWERVRVCVLLTIDRHPSSAAHLEEAGAGDGGHEDDVALLVCAILLVALCT